MSAIKVWERTDTQEWISALECRVNDLEYHKKLAIEWCEEHDITNPDHVVKCLIATFAWVSYMRFEQLSYGELYDLLNIPPETSQAIGDNINFDHVFEFKLGVGESELETVLEEIAKSF